MVLLLNAWRLFLKVKTKRIKGDVKENKERREHADKDDGLHVRVGCIIHEIL